ncbi:MAG: DUF4221 family protein [Saprospiraceae bacterium]|nr:DUF4221 family protein [Saprospiraceae bacterium]
MKWNIFAKRTGTICLLSYFLIVVCSCVKNETEPITLRPSQHISIPIISSVPPSTFCIRYLETDDDELVYYLDRDRNRIIIYSIRTLDKVKELKFLNEGDQGVGTITGFSILSQDSIILSSLGKPWFYLINENGIIIQKIDFRWDNDSQEAVYTPLSSKHNSEVYKYKDNLYFLQQLYQATTLARNYKVVAEYNLSNRRGVLTDFYFPKDYFDNGRLLDVASLAFDGQDKLVYSLRGSHYLYVYNVNTKLTNKVEAVSEYLDDFKIVEGNSPLDYFEYIVKNGGYESIIFDKYRNLFYRIVRLKPNDLSTIKKNELQNAVDFPDRFSIIVFDKDLIKMSETVLDGNYYNIYNFFVGKEGLYISNNNPSNPNYDEDMLQFEVLK